MSVVPALDAGTGKAAGESVRKSRLQGGADSRGEGPQADDDQPSPSKKTLSGYLLSPAVPGRNGMSAVHTSKIRRLSSGDTSELDVCQAITRPMMGNTLIEKDENVLMGNSHSGRVFGIGKADETPPSSSRTSSGSSSRTSSGSSRRRFAHRMQRLHVSFQEVRFLSKNRESPSESPNTSPVEGKQVHSKEKTDECTRFRQNILRERRHWCRETPFFKKNR